VQYHPVDCVVHVKVVKPPSVEANLWEDLRLGM